MSLTPVSHYDGLAGAPKLPLCRRCLDKVAVAQCKKCGHFLCMDCRHIHKCKKKKNESN